MFVVEMVIVQIFCIGKYFNSTNSSGANITSSTNSTSSSTNISSNIL